MTKTRLVVLAVLAISVFGLAAAYFSQSKTEAGFAIQPKGSDPQVGAMLYAANCASCHGAALEGEPNWRSEKDDGTLPAPPHDETGHTWHHGDALLFSYTKLGGKAALEASGVTGFQSGMPAFGDILDDQEIWDILAFIKSTWPERVQEAQQARSAADREQDGS